MASYFQDLTNTGKERYKARLEVVGLSVKDDPYMPYNEAKFAPKCLCGRRFNTGTSLPTSSPDLARTCTLKNSYSIGNN